MVVLAHEYLKAAKNTWPAARRGSMFAPVSELILGIETSCDETAAAVVRDGHVVLSNVVHSQIHLNARWRGVVPEVASRSHTERILPIVAQALQDAAVTPLDLDAVATPQSGGKAKVRG